jgi:hypothetical protein
VLPDWASAGAATNRPATINAPAETLLMNLAFAT